MRINYNVSAMLANNSLANNNDLLSKSLERLSSGLKVNHAKDNPAGLAMAKRMDAQITGLDVASQNASDGISVIEIADGALTEITEMIQRMNELAIKSANGTLSDNDRELVQKEVAQLKEEIDRISEVTEFNGQPLLNGDYELKGYTNNVDIKVNYYSPDVPVREYTLNSLVVSKVTAPVVSGTTATVEVSANMASTTAANTKMVFQIDNIEFGAGFPEDAIAEVKDDFLIIKASNGFLMKLDITRAEDGKDYGTTPIVSNGTSAAVGTAAVTGTAASTGLLIDATGIGPMRLQVGANEGQILEVCIPAMSLKNLSIDRLDVSTKTGALEGIIRITDALAYVNEVRGRLGAYQNRLESTTRNLDVTSENMTAAYSRIMDVDMAEEMTNYTTNQVLVQAGTSMLAQANERPSQVLQLLQ
ncbi:MAG: hypothetical protein NC417_04565 [Candidatus Gastranaerophilales bacterium]|nr:hypothetical protein [Candidatus Gastranaerophilales bacterium]